MKKLKNKKTIVFIIVLLVLFVGGTIAYYRSSDVLENIFNAGTYKTVATEVFESPTNWKPGDETPKTVTIKNEGTIPVRARISLGIEWRNANGGLIDSYIMGNNGAPELAAIVNYDNLDDWTRSNGYYYYNDILNPNDVTSSLLKSVTFNPNVENSIVCTKSNNGLTETCESTDLGYDGGTFKLFVNIETVQASAYLEVWELDHSPYEYVGNNPCAFNGELVQGAEYVNGDYTYRYMQEYQRVSASYPPEMAWVDILDSGWGVKLTNSQATSVTSEMCSSINNKPIVSTSYLFFNSPVTSINLDIDTSNVNNMEGMFANARNLTSVDLSEMDTKNVRNMSGMFLNDSFTNVDFNELNTSNVTTMSSMFQGYSTTGNLDLSGFDTSDVEVMTGMFALANIGGELNIPFDTTNVKAMSNMFYQTQIDEINLYTFDVTGVVVMDDMFAGTTAHLLHTRSAADKIKLMSSSNYPSTLYTGPE